MRMASQMSPKKPRVLVVDDNPFIVELLGDLMQVDGYEVVSAADGPEALAQVAADPPDLILLDIMMPGQDGYAVCRQLKQQPATRWERSPRPRRLRGRRERRRAYGKETRPCPA